MRPLLGFFGGTLEAKLGTHVLTHCVGSSGAAILAVDSCADLVELSEQYFTTWGEIDIGSVGPLHMLFWKAPLYISTP